MFNPVEPRLLATANSKEGVGLWDIRKPRRWDVVPAVCLLPQLCGSQEKSVVFFFCFFLGNSEAASPVISKVLLSILTSDWWSDSDRSVSAESEPSVSFYSCSSNKWPPAPGMLLVWLMSSRWQCCLTVWPPHWGSSANCRIVSLQKKQQLMFLHQ